MKADNSILFKKLFINGAAITLICVSTISEATTYTVNNNLDPGNGVSLRARINTANADPNSTVDFGGGLASQQITLGSVLPPITANMTIDATTVANLQIERGGLWTNSIFTITSGTLTLKGNGDSIHTPPGSNYVNWFGSIVNNSALVFNQSASSLYGGNITGTGSVTVTAPGQTLTFTGANTYTGGTTITSGTLVVGANNTLPTTGSVVVQAPGALTINGVGIVQTLGDISGSGNVNLLGGSALTVGGSNNSTTFSGAFTATGALIKNGTGTLTLSGANTATGFTTINNGTIKVPTGGAISGTVDINNLGTLEMNGGTVTGTILNTPGSVASTLLVTGAFTQASAINNVQTINVNSGGNFTTQAGAPFAGFTTFNIASGGTTNLGELLTIPGGATLTNSGTLNMNGNAINGGVGSNLNINSTLETTGAINLGAGNLNINQGGTLLFNQNVTASVVNAGTITPMTAAPAITGSFAQNATGLLKVNITNNTPGNYTAYTASSATLNGGTVAVTLPNGITGIHNGDTFDVLSTTGMFVNLTLPTVSGSNMFVNFSSSISGNALRLTATKNSFTQVNRIQALNGISGALDTGTTNSNRNAAIAALAASTSLSDYETKLAQLAPTGLNNSLYAPTIAAQEASVDTIFDRLEARRPANTPGVGTPTASVGTHIVQSGYAAGDMLENHRSFGPLFFGNSMKQSVRGGLAGYKALTGGFGFAGDVPVLEYFRVGLGATYGNTAVKQQDSTGSHINIGGTQGMAYGSATYGPFFLDGVLSLGLNKYHGRRNITFVNQSATSSYTGTQSGAKLKAGFSFPVYRLEVSPMATLQYVHLKTGSYTEQGAPGLNLSVAGNNTSLTRGGLGFRIADRSREECFFPEIHALYLADLNTPNLNITSQFADGGASFVSNGVLPPKDGMNVGASITALLSENVMLRGGYDLEAKKSFRSHTASLKFKWLF